MSQPPNPKPASPLSLLLSALITVFLLYQVLTATEPPSTLLSLLYWVVILANIGFLGFSLWKRAQK